MYRALSISQCADYEFVKGRNPQAYEFVQKLYSQKFRKLVNQGNQIYIESACDKGNVYDRLLLSMKVSDFFMLMVFIS